MPQKEKELRLLNLLRSLKDECSVKPKVISLKRKCEEYNLTNIPIICSRLIELGFLLRKTGIAGGIHYLWNNEIKADENAVDVLCKGVEEYTKLATKRAKSKMIDSVINREEHKEEKEISVLEPEILEVKEERVVSLKELIELFQEEGITEMKMTIEYTIKKK